ncbi:hypothetical protein B0H11DRAFT_2103455 [Mycena galericulata]|nr:hypothetical protein B0H11DRAFT_2103455 [Mycena galericulata]
MARDRVPIRPGILRDTGFRLFQTPTYLHRIHTVDIQGAMPAVQSGKVLVSGANGFIAAWVVRELLKQGYSVRGVVRSEDKAAPLREIFRSYGDKLELVVVPDITEDGAFDEAVKGVDAIEHTASPFHLREDSKPDDFIVPAIKGTVGILLSALKYGKSVKRIVITSSCAAVLEVLDEPKTFNEENWNQQAPKLVKESPDEASPINKYRASKTLAERAAWQFVEDHGEIGWDLVVLNPPFVFGPTIHDVPTASALGTSARHFYDTLTQPVAKPEMLRTGSCWIDVRDLGIAHVLALRAENAGGERIIVSAGPFVWQDWLDAAPPSAKYQKGVPGSGKDVVHQIRYDNRKAERLLGMTNDPSKAATDASGQKIEFTVYRTMEETARDTVADWEKRGWQ